MSQFWQSIVKTPTPWWSCLHCPHNTPTHVNISFIPKSYAIELNETNNLNEYADEQSSTDLYIILHDVHVCDMYIKAIGSSMAGMALAIQTFILVSKMSVHSVCMNTSAVLHQLINCSYHV